MNKTKFAPLIMWCLLLTTSVAAQASNYGLLVGVSEYPNLAPELSLSGPVNDVKRAHQMLLGQGIEDDHIIILADGVENAKLPTKANIVNAMRELAKQAKAGDFFYLHFSGHGSQQPTMDFQTEVDGLDEIFLPRDITDWDDETGTVPNALTDDEVGELVNAIRDKGANVWLIFDSCHSGTMSRSVTASSVKMRSVKPAALGIPAVQQNAEVSDRSVALFAPQTQSEPAANGRGGLVAFYAAQSTEEAPEMALPTGDAELPQGLFSFVLTSVVSRFPNISYDQLAQIILLEYNSLPWLRTTPLFEGEALQQSLFHRNEHITPRYAVNVLSGAIAMNAGVLQGFERGALVALYNDPIAKEPFTQGRVVSADLATAKLETAEVLDPVTYYAELLQPAMPPQLKVKWLATPADNWQTAQSALAEHPLLGRTIQWVNSDAQADLGLYAASKALYVFTAQDTLPCALPVAIKGQCTEGNIQYKNQPLGLSDVQDVLTSVLSRTVRAMNLLRLSARMADTGTITSLVMRQQPGQTFSPLALDEQIVLNDGDVLRAEFINTAPYPVDLTIMFIDSQFGISQIYPDPGTSGRLNSGEMTDFEGQINAQTTGNEQFLVIATPVSREAPATNLLHLQQPSLDSTVFTRAVGGKQDIFAQALGDAPQSRGFTKIDDNTSSASISVVRWVTKPR